MAYRPSLQTLLATLLLGTLLGACASTPTATPTAIPPTSAPSETPTDLPPTPTATNTPPPTETPTATPIPDLTATAFIAGLTHADITIPHSLEDRTACNDCHAPDGEQPNPDDHSGRSNDTCTLCHLAADDLASAPDAQAFTQAECLTCHGPFEALSAREITTVADDNRAINPHVYVPHDTTDIIECTVCHQPHTLPASSLEDLASSALLSTCYHCHHMQTFDPCGPCHGDIPAVNYP